ncbi:MAG: hypothetical protein PUB89_05260 [Oscillospiraceae bacterium]|nr:hypothetical protein [Oscillospiraceae bacterium]
MYSIKKWVDEVVDSTTGEIIQQGTPQSAKNFNNMEDGILDASIASNFLIIAVSQLISEQNVEVKELAFTNTARYPFNNSAKTVSIATRANTNYTVDATVIEHSGDVGDIIVYDKMINGFKVRYDGSAKSATIKLAVRGGC